MASLCTSGGASCCAAAPGAVMTRWSGARGGRMSSAAVLVGGRSDFLGNSVWDTLRRVPSGSKVDSQMKTGHGGVLVVARSTNGSAPPYRPPRPSGTGNRRGQSRNQEPKENDGPLMNSDIRVPLVRVLDVEQTMLGIMSSAEALQKARDADVDLVMISSEADPPVVRMMNYSKYRYEMQKKKREAQKKAAASRQVLKELKMRYNIDTHDYAVRQRAAHKFLTAGDKVKVVCQFKGRELDFKDLAVKLFMRFQEEIGPLAVLESKISLEGKTMSMVLAPNKAAIQRAHALAQSKSAKVKSQASAKEGKLEGDGDVDDDGEDIDENENDIKNEDVDDDDGDEVEDHVLSKAPEESPASV